jgi:PAS domain-containing protein
MSLPAMNAGDLRGYLELERERLFPLPGATLLCDAAIVSPAPQGGQQIVRFGAIRRTLAEDILARAAEAGITPLALGVAGDPGTPRYDFARGLRAEGLLPSTGGQRQIWWALVAGLFLLNVGLLIWRDQQSVAQLQTIVDAQQPAVRVYHAIAARNVRAESLAARSANRRLASQPLGDLALATAALPTAAWVQRYSWNERTLQLAGYSRGDVDLLTALRSTPRFANVRATTSDVQADIPIGRPFDISIDLKRRGQ